jgi:hypothetical protein
MPLSEIAQVVALLAASASLPWIVGVCCMVAAVAASVRLRLQQGEGTMNAHQRLMVRNHWWSIKREKFAVVLPPEENGGFSPRVIVPLRRI